MFWIKWWKKVVMIKWIVPVKFGNFFESFFLCWKLIYTMYLQNMNLKGCLGRFNPQTCIFFVFCGQLLSASSIMHVPISEQHEQWHWCLHFSISLKYKEKTIVDNYVVRKFCNKDFQYFPLVCVRKVLKIQLSCRTIALMVLVRSTK